MSDFQPIRYLRIADLGARVEVRDGGSVITGVVIDSLEALSSEAVSGELIFDSVAIHTPAGVSLYLAEDAEYRLATPDDPGGDTNGTSGSPRC